MVAFLVITAVLIAIVVGAFAASQQAPPSVREFSRLPRKFPLLPREDNGERVAILFLPGILMDHRAYLPPDRDEKTPNGVLGQARLYGDVFVVEYDTRTIIPVQIIESVRSCVCQLVRPYDKVIIVGSSVGGQVALHVMAGLLDGEATRKRVRYIIQDSPWDSRDLGLGGDIGAPIFRFGGIGHLFRLPGLRSMRIPGFMLGLPKYDETEEPWRDLCLPEGVNLVEWEAKERMRAFTLGTWLQWMAFMARPLPGLPVLSEEVKAEIRPVEYLRCDEGNVTVRQPQAAEKWHQGLAKSGVEVSPITAVDSPHCGMMQKPNTWASVFDRALQRALS